MKKIWLVGLNCMALICIVASPVLAKQAPQKPTLAIVDRKINDLSKRLSIMESNFNRFQIGGGLLLEPNVSPDYNNGNVEIKQQMDLFFDAAIAENMQFSLRMSQRGGWGINYQNANPNAIPLTSPLMVDEAFLRIEKQKHQDYLGRFRYSLGQYGLIADLFTTPVEGLAIQQQFGDFYAIGLYSQIGPKYQQGTDILAGIEDYSAARLGWVRSNTIWGLNLVPNGITGEKAWSIDWSFHRAGGRGDGVEIKAELGWYRFQTEENPDYVADWTPGVLIGYSKIKSSDELFQLKTGYFPVTFTPSSSSLGHVSGVYREWFVPNSQGVEVFWRKKISESWQTEDRFIVLAPVDVLVYSEVNYRFRGSFIKIISPINQVQFGIEGNTYEGKIYPRAFLSWNLRF